MAETTWRVLTLLSLLESRATWSGPELAAELGVTTRTIRRDVERLRELGYPVHGEQGTEGGYRLGRGRRLPPLVLDDDEAVAVALCLRAGAAGVLLGVEEQALRALTKLDQVLPARLSAKVHAIDDATAALPSGAGPRVDTGMLTRLAHGCQQRVRARLGYTARSGESSERHVEPYRLVTTGRLWYLFCFDLDRQDWRTFRLDRITDLHITTFRFRPRPSPDPVAHVRRAFANRPAWAYTVTVVYDAPLDAVTARIPARYADCATIPDGRTQVVAGADELEQLAMHLAWAAIDLDAELEVIEPAELRVELRRLADQVAGYAGR
ncbi:transcriptional regulator [Enemella evansiae]|uniref:helix-turn-helix transcriptional regulator n=1 Tax=Enemella evansiae TaxID=2016499 RepID=UPI000B975472|nr:WYL domain-containing protein [Enemella evansiae]OYN92968.1 transcriptional regulator [Enemella evansiae]